MFVCGWIASDLALTIEPTLFGPSNASRVYNGVVTSILVLTVWFANFAEALAEGRGKAKADALRRTRSTLSRPRARGRHKETVPAKDLRKATLSGWRRIMSCRPMARLSREPLRQRVRHHWRIGACAQGAGTDMFSS